MKIFENYRLGLVLALIIIVMFLVVSIFFADTNYFKTSMFLNSFVLPAVNVFLTLMGLLYLKKQKGTLSFKQGFKFSYFNQMVGFLISMAFIMFFMNVISPSTRDLFNYQFYDSFYQEAKKEYEQNGTLEIPVPAGEDKKQASEEYLSYLKDNIDNKKNNVFSFSSSKFWIMVFIMNLFYLINSIFLSMFVKTPKPIR